MRGRVVGAIFVASLLAVGLAGVVRRDRDSHGKGDSAEGVGLSPSAAAHPSARDSGRAAPRTDVDLCAPSDAGPRALDELSDMDLRAIADRPISFREWALDNPPGCVVGRHDRTPVRMEIRCGDACPDQSIRIVRFDAAPKDCAAVRGVVVRRYVPHGPAGPSPEPTCVPPVLSKDPPGGTARWDYRRPRTMECGLDPSPDPSCFQ